MYTSILVYTYLVHTAVVVYSSVAVDMNTTHEGPVLHTEGTLYFISGMYTTYNIAAAVRSTRFPSETYLGPGGVAQELTEKEHTTSD